MRDFLKFMRNFPEFMRDFPQTIFAALILALGALWAFIVLYAYIHLLWTGASYLWHWVFN